MIDAFLEVLYHQTDIMFNYRRDFLIVSDERDMAKMVVFANENFPKTNEEPWTFDDIIESITGEENRWGYANEFVFCGCCDAAVSFKPTPWPEGWFDESFRDYLCETCIKKHHADYYLEAIINNPANPNLFLDEQVLEEKGFALLPNSLRHINTKWECFPNYSRIQLSGLLDKYDEVIINITHIGHDKVSWNVYTR